MFRFTVNVDASPVPFTATIDFTLPAGSTDAEAITVAKGIRAGYKNAYGTRVQVAALQEVGMTRDVTLGA